MRIKLERAGGFANVRRTFEVDAASLPPALAEELRRLVADADVATFSENPTPLAGRPDRFIYHLTVEDDAGTRTVTVSEDSASDAMRRLLDRLQRTAAV